MHSSPGIVNPSTGSGLPVEGEAALSTFYAQQGIYPEFIEGLTLLLQPVKMEDDILKVKGVLLYDPKIYPSGDGKDLD
jgi:hypothetical protein